MRRKKTIEETIKDSTTDDAANDKDTRRRWFSGLAFAVLVFVVAYAVFASTFGHWGTALGWMPSSAIAAASGWIGYSLPWIGDVIAVLFDLLTLLSLFI